jgi:hypothetical protein
MNLFNWLSVFLKVRKPVEDMIDEAKQMNSIKEGYKTTEFWLNMATQIATLWGAVQGFIPPKWAAIISTAGIAVYTVARTILKAVSDVKAANATAPQTVTATLTSQP